MDPYLEHPVIWTGVHQNLITYTNAALNALLPPGYGTNMGERLYVMQSDRSIYPDLAVYEQPQESPAAKSSAPGAAAVCDPPWVLVVEPLEVREVFIEILSLAGGAERVVTAIEFLSFTNKPLGSDGRKLYVTKQRELLGSRVNLLEVDLLRNTEHIVAAPREELTYRGRRWDYLVSLHRGNAGTRFEVWAVTVRQRLPRVLVPLAEGDPDLVLDLQRVFERCYDEAGYARRIDYRKDPYTPLEGFDAAWADAILKGGGHR
ncbi:MAG: DUF4058 family protein [Planctomycetes bacterium]|nr:DUF4058 family protein [Planctomycetota bacterium]